MRVAILALLFAASAAQGQGYPTKPIHVLVPFAPGGAVDTTARVLAQAMQQRVNWNFVIENRPGGNGFIATTAVQKAAPDGYTLLMAHTGEFAVNPALFDNVPYELERDFLPITMVSDAPMLYLATAKAPFNTFQELVAQAKAKPGSISFGSAGNGSINHLAGEWLAQATGTKLLHVPYKGGGAAITDLIPGNVHMLFASVLELSGHIKAGKLKALAITSKQRVPALPDVPTLEEAGVTGAESGSWLGLLAPAGTPQPIVDKVSQDLQKVLAMPDVQQQLLAQGAVARGGTPADFAGLIATDRQKYARIITENNLSAD